MYIIPYPSHVLGERQSTHNEQANQLRAESNEVFLCSFQTITMQLQSASAIGLLSLLLAGGAKGQAPDAVDTATALTGFKPVSKTHVSNPAVSNFILSATHLSQPTYLMSCTSHPQNSILPLWRALGPRKHKGARTALSLRVLLPKSLKLSSPSTRPVMALEIGT